MATIITRVGKGSPLTNAEVDANFTNLNSELATKADSSLLASYQPLDGDLTAIAGLSGSTGILRKTAANTWSLDTNTYLTSFTETDPIFSASPAAGISNTNISNWNTAYNWGNHASAGYLTSFTETDPTVGSHIKAITTTNISNWNTAYGWGNHASAGYLTGITSGQVTTALGYTPANKAGETFSGNVGIGTAPDSPLHVYSPLAGMRIGFSGQSQNYFDADNQYFRTNAGAGALTLNGGSVTAHVDLRAPIFYDSNDTGYYVNPNSASLLVALGLQADEGLNVKGIRGGFSAGSDGQGIHLFSNVDIGYPSGWGVGLSNTPSRGLSVYGGGRFSYGGSGFLSADTSVRAPIFYDSGNTAYYVDPNSGSRMGNITADNLESLGSLTVNSGPVYRSSWVAGFQSQSDFADGTLVATDIPANISDGDSFLIEITGKTYDGSNPPIKVIAQGYLYANTIIAHSGISYGGNFASYLKVLEEGGVLKFWWPRISYWNSFEVRVIAVNGPTNGNITRNRVTGITNSTEPSASKKVQINLTRNMRADISATNSVDLRAPIFYDSNNTAFYVSPDDNSLLSAVRARGQIRATGWWDSYSGSTSGLGIEIGQSGNRGFILSYNRDSSVYGPMSFEATDFSFNGMSGAYAQINTSFRAPIFYDSNNTGYYLDPQSGSRLGGQILFDGGSLVASNGDITARRSNGTTGVLYFAGGSPYLYWNGTEYVFSTTGPVTTGIDMRASLFYDVANTGYYIDPASTSNLNGLNVGGRNMRRYGENRYIEFTVGGDANTYYPVLLQLAGTYFEFAKWSITRHYADTAPWDPIGTGVHRGGLTLTWCWSGDGAWGGNDKAFRVEQFNESYTTIVGGMQLSVNGMIVWLRGGGATYKFHGTGGMDNGVNVYLSTFEAANGATFAPRSYNSTTVTNEVMSRFPIRNSGNGGELWDGNTRVLSDDRWINGKYFGSNSSVYGGIFYDSSDSSYYVDPASGSVLRGGVTIHDNGTAASPLLDIRADDGGPWGIRLYRSDLGGGAQMYASSATHWYHSGALRAAAAMYAPIFYDEDNTAYYVDPSSNSTSVYTDGLIVAGNQGFQSRVYAVGARNRIWSFGNADAFGLSYFQGAAGIGSADTIGFHFGTATAAASTLQIVGNNYTQSLGSMRAPLFYDSDNTAFYIDAAGSSYVNTLNAGIIVAQSSNDAQLYLNGNGTSWAGIAFTDISNSDYLWYNGSTSTFALGGGGATGTNKKLHVNGGVTIGSGLATTGTSTNGLLVEARVDAPIYYDSANTAYYVDPATGSKIRGLLEVEGDHYNTEIRLTATGLGSGVNSAMSWWVSEPNVTWNEGGFGFNVTNDGGTPNGFGRLNTSFGQAYTRYTTSGNMAFYCTDTGGTRYNVMTLWSNNTIGVDNILSAAGSLRAPIFYDSNNTNFYIDAASTSNINQLNANGKIVLETFDSFLRINQYNGFSSGIWMGPSNIGGSGELHLGSNGTPSTARVRVIGGTYNGSVAITLNGSDGSITAAGNITAFSDIRVKDNVDTIADALAKLSAVRGVTYTRTDLDDKERVYAGVIAQEIEQVLPEAVREINDIKTVDYNATIALLIQAVKELNAKVWNLEAQLATK